MKEKTINFDYRQIVEAFFAYSDNLLFLLDKDLNILQLNSQSKKLTTSLNKKNFTGNIHNLFPTLDLQFLLMDKKCKPCTYSCKLVLDEHPIKIEFQVIPILETKTKPAQFLLIGSLHSFELSQLHLELLQLNNVVKLSPGLLYWKNFHSVYQGCNEEFARLAGLQASEEVKGKTDFDLSWKDRAQLYVDVDQEVMNTGIAKLNHIERITVSDNKVITAITNKVPMLNKQGKIIGLLGITTDITHQKEIEQALSVAKEAAEAANRAKDHFLANMSHDIRTPLTGIIGISALLEQQVHDENEKEYARWVNASGEQLLTLLNSVLDIVSIGDNQENHIKCEPVSISQLLSNIAALELPTIKLKQLELKVITDPSVPEIVLTDPVKIHRILLNLLGNAIKFTDKGTITMKARFSALTAINGELELLVSDTGTGIAKENLNKVFDRFYRGDPSYKGQYTGFGVGLHIVQQYVELLKGKISLESKLGQGTTFKVILNMDVKKMPATNKEQKVLSFNNQKPVKKEPANLLLNSKNSPFILLVEDNAVALKVVESIVAQTNCRFISATTGEQALELSKKHNFDLILSDNGLPGISGDDLCLQIRQFEKITNKAPAAIIGLTAHMAPDAQEISLKKGMNKIIAKPITLPVLEQLLQEFVPFKETIPTNQHEKNETALPDAAKELFHLEPFPLLDIEAGISTLGDLGTLRELTSLMINQELPNDLINIKQAFEQQSWQKVEKIAHKMKSSAIYCGTIRMKLACQYLEYYLKGESGPLKEPLYDQLLNTAVETQEAIRQWLAS